MKKIFAIALALVMVLSMASAFASACTTGFDWSCSTSTNKCGKATVEVIPYVKVNTACAPYYDYEASTCAAAVSGNEVYYAVKVVLDANLDREWWASIKAPVTITYKGMAENEPELVAIMLNDVYDEDETTLYYNFANESWEVEDDNFSFGAKNLEGVVVEKAADAKVCAKLEAYDDGVLKNGIVGDYKVWVNDALDKIIVTDVDDDANVVTFSIKDGKVNGITESHGCNANFINEVIAFFGLNFGTCVTDDAIEANFGWDDEVKSCFSWSSNAASVVDAECVVAIPKTGDVSVVAYAVMAVVAAAGTMLKK